VPVAVLAGLLSTREATSAAVDACLPVAGRWRRAARYGLTDPGLARAAVAVFTLAIAALPGLVGPGPVRELVEGFTERYVLRGRCPADDHPRKEHP
jgi:glutamate--cysteine ligase